MQFKSDALRTDCQCQPFNVTAGVPVAYLEVAADDENVDVWPTLCFTTLCNGCVDGVQSPMTAAFHSNPHAPCVIGGHVRVRDLLDRYMASMLTSS